MPEIQFDPWVFALVGGLTEVVKLQGIPTRFLPIVALLIGGAANVYMTGHTDPLTVSTGLLAGLTVTGIINRTDKYVTQLTKDKAVLAPTKSEGPNPMNEA